MPAESPTPTYEVAPNTRHPRSVIGLAESGHQRRTCAIDITRGGHSTHLRPLTVDIGQSTSGRGNHRLDLALGHIALGMGTTSQKLSSSPEPRHRRRRFTNQHHLDKRDTSGQRRTLKPFNELDPAKELRNNHVMPRPKVRIDQRDRQIPSHQLGFRPFLPPSQLGSKKIDVDDEHKGATPSECLGEGRLPDAGESIDVDEPSDTPSCPTEA